MNKFIGMGRLAKDVDVRVTDTTKIARFPLAIPRRYKKDDTDH